MNVTYLTPEGYRRLREELEYLRTVKRQEIAQRLHEALAEGGELIENMEYEAAKQEQAFVEGRIQELEHLLATAKVIERPTQAEVVEVGSQVTIQDEDGGPEETYTIVGPAEADPAKGYISNESPLGRALLGHRVGDVVEVDAPAGRFRVRIVRIA
ncbi:MAG: transcription elongation factor GreA [Chloroflexi bacterium]|nr:transcription elongation factor GreA [Chloroflexota bacterium]